MWTWESPMLGQKCPATDQPLLSFVDLSDVQQREGVVEVISPSSWDHTCVYLTGKQSACQCVFCASAAPCTLFSVNCCSPACSWGCTPTCFIQSYRTCGEASLMADLRVDVCITSTKCSLWKPLQIESAFVLHRQYRQVKEVVFHCELLRTGSSSEQAVPWNWQYLGAGSTSELAVAAAFPCYCEELSYSCIHNNCNKKVPVIFFLKQGNFICFLWVLFISRCLDKFL